MTNPTIETRWFKGLEVRQAADGQVSTLRGYGLKWSETINYGGRFRERFMRGAFAGTLAREDVKLLVGHNYEGLPLARTENGTMRVTENSVGLLVEADLNEADPEVLSVAEKIRAGNVDGMSVGFSMGGGKETIKAGAVNDEGVREPDLHIIEEVGSLREISIVAFAAYQSSSASIRDIEQGIMTRCAPQSGVEPSLDLRLRLLDLEIRTHAIMAGVKEHQTGESHDKTGRI